MQDPAKPVVGQRKRRSARDAELDAVMQRFFDLSAGDQLRAFERAREFLGGGAPVETRADREITRRSDSLAALTRVADHLGLNGRAPTVKEFDRVAVALGLEWTARRVGHVWGRWRFACDALLGERPRLTAEQQALRHRFSGRKRSADDYLTALRLWAATNPPLARAADYNVWVRQHNDQLVDAELPLPHAATIRSSLAIRWIDALRIGRGEITVEQAATRTISPRKDWTSGPHNLVGLKSAAQILRVGEGHCDYLSWQPGFPTPVAIFSHGRAVRAWLRPDVERFRETGKAPTRKRDGLRSRYYNTFELAPLVGLTPVSLIDKRLGDLAPTPTGRVGGIVYWLKRDADRWIRENKDLIEQRQARGRIPRRRRSGANPASVEGFGARRPDKNGRARRKPAKSSR